MKKKKQNKTDNKLTENQLESKEYTIEELIELGEKNNKIKLASPLFDRNMPIQPK